jgi:hypothetical protein
MLVGLPPPSRASLTSTAAIERVGGKLWTLLERARGALAERRPHPTWFKVLVILDILALDVSPLTLFDGRRIS